MEHTNLQMELTCLRKNDENTLKIWNALRDLVRTHYPDPREERYCVCEAKYPCDVITIIEKVVS